MVKAARLLLFVFGVLIFTAGTCRAGPETAGQNTAVSKDVFEKIEAAVRAKNFNNAESLLNKYLASGASPAPAHFQMGRIFFDQQDWTRAAESFQKSLQLAASNDQAHLLLGLTYRQLKRPDDAERELLAAARLNPQSDVNSYFAGHQLLLNSKAELALPYFYKAAELNPRNQDALRALGMTQARLGNYGLAETYYRKALIVADNSAEQQASALTDLAFLLLLGHEEEKNKEATSLAQKVTELQPESPAGHYLLGKALLKLGKPKDAVRALEKAVQLSPQDGKAHFLLAQAYDQIGDRVRASKERETVVNIRREAFRSGAATTTPGMGSEE